MSQTYCHLDHLESNRWRVRVTALLVTTTTDEKGREVHACVNGPEVDRFEIQTDLRGRRLREHAEREAERRLKERS